MYSSLFLFLVSTLGKDGETDFVKKFCLHRNLSYTLIDIGANNGAWSKDFIAFCKRKADRVILFEPNPHFRDSISELVKKYHIEYIPCIAWFENNTFPFFIGQNSETSSMVKRMSTRYGIRQNINVKSTDIRPYLRNNYNIFMKLDIEGGEYELLSHLINDRLLCQLDHLLVEWHLNAMSPKNRLSCLGLRWYLDFHVRTVCPKAVEIHHSEYEGNNFGAIVPGLSEENNKRLQMQKYKWDR